MSASCGTRLGHAEMGAVCLTAAEKSGLRESGGIERGMCGGFLDMTGGRGVGGGRVVGGKCKDNE